MGSKGHLVDNCLHCSNKSDSDDNHSLSHCLIIYLFILCVFFNPVYFDRYIKNGMSIDLPNYVFFIFTPPFFGS